VLPRAAADTRGQYSTLHYLKIEHCTSTTRTSLPGTSRRMVHWGADKSRAQSRAKPGRLWARSQAPTRTAAPQLPAQPRAVRSTSAPTTGTSRFFWPSYGASSCTKGKQRKIKSESRKDERGYLFRLPGHMNFDQ
jgi:hypothetical protein